MSDNCLFSSSGLFFEHFSDISFDILRTFLNGEYSRGVLLHNNRFVLKTNVAIASKVSISSKDSLATTDFLAKITQLANSCRKPPTEPPHSRFPNFFDIIDLPEYGFCVRFHAVKVSIFGGFPVGNPTKKEPPQSPSKGEFLCPSTVRRGSEYG